MEEVSVIIIAYNIEQYIEKCIKSVINQTFKEIEILIVNDGSTDKTLSIINEWALKDKRIKIINQVNKGAIEARKAGLDKCNGKYVLFVDGDDWLELNAIERLYNEIEQDQADIVVYNSYIVDDFGRKIVRSFNIEIYNDKDLLKNLLIGKSSPFLWDKFIRKSFIIENKVKFPKEVSYSEDLAALVEIYSKHPKVSVLGEELYNYYQRVDSATKQLNNKSLDICKSIDFIHEVLEENKLYNIFLDELEMCIYLNLFIYVVINFNKHNAYNKSLYRMYKKKNINIIKNQYINEHIGSYNKNGQVRIRLYNRSYYLGCFYDYIRKIIKCIINK
ncbi:MULTISPECIES: glycosyltransferase family 2 protein [Clostridia]|uniref:Glycosyltransferase family 2 protein n=2 Tax=Clostridia TaxID=186801 RepID=A0A8I0DNB2_9CLOT|nr:MULTISPECIES: glycosyltransferase family 2 protein [Clostridia]MBC5638951.1 glycosyltransferase family 2 protein [Clostridium lentum]MBC5653044.1 glycosyltransferase family 2 protein [Blautia lenta]CDB75075.1 spore coat polysaccharide biosynthesis protein [Clostridium sp. CAG:265]